MKYTGIYLLYLLVSFCYTPTEQVHCLLSCDCSDTSVRFIEGTDCCASGTLPALRANIDITNRSDCTVCPSKCTPPFPPCFIYNFTTVLTARVTRPTMNKFLFEVNPTSTCGGQPFFAFFRGSTFYDNLLSVQSTQGRVFIGEQVGVGTYPGTVSVSLFSNAQVQDTLNAPYSYEVYDAITPNSTAYFGTTFESAIGGQYLFTVGINETDFSLLYSITFVNLGQGTANLESASIDTNGHVFTETPVTVGTYNGQLNIAYTHNTDTSLKGTVDVAFSFNTIYPVTLIENQKSRHIAFPPSPTGVLAFTVEFSFAAGFSMDDFTYDFTDSTNILNIDHTTGQFVFPFTSTTVVKRYPDSGNTRFRASYLSKEMFDNNGNQASVYKRTIEGVYDLTIVDPCGFSASINSTCLNSGTCSLSGLSFICTCTAFYTGDRCEIDVNECSDSSFCNNFPCTNTHGGFVCNCSSGYTGERCSQNINECLITPSVCLNGGLCIDNPGNYSCDCANTGYTGLHCEVNVNECNVNINLCGSGVCQDLDGTYLCNCTDTGYEGADCSSDIDECSIGPGICQHNGVCTNTNGSFLCDCSNTGFNGSTCTDNIDECRTMFGLCNPGRCVDTFGSYFCDCNGTGFMGAHCSVDVDECTNNLTLCNNGNCTNTIGSYYCGCRVGFKGDNCETDIVECDLVKICNNGTCVNSIGSFACDCNVGFIGDLCNVDVVECATISGLCAPGNCSNTLGSYVCDCTGSGYSGQNCTEDINECTEIANVCNNGTCVNRNGSYYCVCFPGFSAADCSENINECLSTGICNNGSCEDVPGSYFCTCFPGISGAACSEDINECIVNTSICNNGNCINSFGSFECECNTGFVGDLCEIDINECATIPNLCYPGNCSNTQGSHVCECGDTGYTGQNCTEDINECANASLCSPGVCMNSLGSYTCNCSNTGYTRARCEVEINECSLSNTLCGSGICINNPGSFICDCDNTGLIGERCENDINECILYSPCKNSGRCTNTNGSYDCDCTSTGYTGVNCTMDIDECLTQPGICNLGTCVNNLGNFSCICPEMVSGVFCNTSTNGTLICPANQTCTSDSECLDCLCHRNFSYISPVYVLLSRNIEFDGNAILPFEREIQPEISRDVTIFARLRQSYPDRGYVMFIGSSTDYRNLGLFLETNTSTAYVFYTRPNSTSYSFVRVALEVMGPSMHTLAVVLDFASAQARFYKDGVHVANQPLPGPPDYRLGERRNSRVMYVGGRIENAFKFRGDMEYVFLYPFALTSSQIQYLHQNGPITYQGVGRCGQDVLDESCVPRPFYKPSVPTQHHPYRIKTRCDLSRYAKRGLTGEYKCVNRITAIECSENSDCPHAYACGEYLSRDGHSLLPAVFDPYFHGFKYALIETETRFRGIEPKTISITKRPILTLDLSIFTRFKQESNNEGYIVAKGVSAHARDFGLYLRGTSDSVWFVYKSKTGFHDYAVFTNITVDDGNIHTIGVVLLQVDNSRFVYLYVDGVPRGCIKINNRVVFTPEVNRLTVGGRPGNDKFNFVGVIYKLHIFDVALSHSVMLDLHNAFNSDSLVRYCTSLQTMGDECYIERRPPFFKCGTELGCVPSRSFNQTLPVLPQQNICYGAPYTIGQCLSCNCTSPVSNQLVCGTNGVTYANACFLSCAGATLFTQGACVSYAARFGMSAPGE